MSTQITALNDAPSAVTAPTRRTVDAFTRSLHAMMALSFAGAYITAESETFRLEHVTLGYTLGGVLLVRVVWGLWGPKYERWSARGASCVDWAPGSGRCVQAMWPGGKRKTCSWPWP